MAKLNAKEYKPFEDIKQTDRNFGMPVICRECLNMQNGRIFQR